MTEEEELMYIKEAIQDLNQKFDEFIKIYKQTHLPKSAGEAEEREL